MPHTLTLDSMLRVPAAALLDVDALDKLLRVENPEWATATPYARKSMKQWLLFYHLDRATKTVSLPRNFPLTLLQPDVMVADRTAEGQPAPGIRLGEGVGLRDYQARFMVEKVHPAMKAGDTDLHFGVPCGHGKTIMALYMAALYGRRVLVVVTTLALAEQFAKAAAWVTPGASVEMLESGKKWKLTADITIGTYAMLGKEQFDSAFYEQFGHLVLDEWHKSGARTRYPILERAVCRYRTLLSATLRRKDGLAEEWPIKKGILY